MERVWTAEEQKRRNPYNDPAFTFYWKTGKREVHYGRDPAEALNKAGYGGGAVRALDFYASGDDSNYRWNETTREWVATPEPPGLIEEAK